MRKSFFAAPLFLAVLFLCPAELSAQKKVLDHDVYDSWESVTSLSVTDDGNIAAYQIRPQQGDSRLVFHNLESGARLEVERGTGLVIPRDAEYGVFMVKAPYAETRQAKIDGKKPDEMPRDSVAYVNLKTFELVNLGAAKSFKTGYSASPYIFVSLYSEDEDKGEASDLLMLTTATGETDTLRNVLSYTVSRTGEKLAAVMEKEGPDSTTLKTVRFYDFPAGLDSELSSGKEEYASLLFNDADDKLLFTATDEKEDSVGTPAYSIFLTEETVVSKATRRSPAVKTVSTSEILPDHAEGLPEGWLVSSETSPRFSNASSRIIMELYRQYPAKDTTVVDFEAAGLDIWVWDSYNLPPMDKAGYFSESLTAVVNLDAPGTLVTLSSNPFDYIMVPEGGDADFAISENRGRYALADLWAENNTADYSLINLRDGSRRMLFEGLVGMTTASPSGRWLMWFNPEDGGWYCKDLLADGGFVNLSGQTGYPFYDEKNDMPCGYLPLGYPQWTEDEKYVLLSDRYDVWRFTPDGSEAVNLTAGEGRKSKTSYSVTRLERQDNPFLFSRETLLPLKEPVYLNAFGEDDMRNGFARIGLRKPSAPAGFLAEYGYSEAMKAADSDAIIYKKGDFRHSMDAYVTRDFWESETRLSAINPQQDDYWWGDVQLVSWNAYDGTPLKGMLYTPENLDPAKKYPMLVYFYEVSSNELYWYTSPAPSRSIINIPFYVSRGYVVFVPDIVYETGHPGESAYNCICSGAEAMCERFSFIDKSRMALQGQSWGGYQTAYLVTRTDMFAAAGAGAPVGNMTSAYGGIRWESGNSRISQYELGQSRIGKTLWEDGALDLYIENSPVFFADKVRTPVLIMHNDADGAVPWYQGIEFFMSLRRLGKPAWLLEYNDEEHNLVERRNCKDLSIRLQQFFDHYLMGAPEPVWMKSGIPYARKGNYFGYENAEDVK